MTADLLPAALARHDLSLPAPLDVSPYLDVLTALTEGAVSLCLDDCVCTDRLSFPLSGGARVCLSRLSSASSRPLLLSTLSALDAALVLDRRVRRLEEALVVESRSAGVDALTGLLNRRSLEESLSSALSSCPSTALVAVTFLDLDGFKPVNDTFGHTAGDELLRLVSARLSRLMRPGDLLGRFGGDEFVAICPGMTESALPSLLERLRSAFATPFVVSGQEVRLGTSVGAALGSVRSDPFELLRQADAAMYEEKRSRKC